MAADLDAGLAHYCVAGLGQSDEEAATGRAPNGSAAAERAAAASAPIRGKPTAGTLRTSS